MFICFFLVKIRLRTFFIITIIMKIKNSAIIVLKKDRSEKNDNEEKKFLPKNAYWRTMQSIEFPFVIVFVVEEIKKSRIKYELKRVKQEIEEEVTQIKLCHTP